MGQLMEAIIGGNWKDGLTGGAATAVLLYRSLGEF